MRIYNIQEHHHDHATRSNIQNKNLLGEYLIHMNQIYFEPRAMSASGNYNGPKYNPDENKNIYAQRKEVMEAALMIFFGTMLYNNLAESTVDSSLPPLPGNHVATLKRKQQKM